MVRRRYSCRTALGGVVDTRPEQRLLKISISVTLAVGVLGVLFGLLINSRAIVFDGMYSLVDVVLTVVSLTVSRFLASEGSRRFQYGYWHFEPLVGTLGGATLSLSCLYAAFNGVEGLMSGGGENISYDFGAAWAAVLTVIGLGMWLLMRRHARRIESGLLALDARSWLVSGLLSLALVVAFCIALAMEGTRFSPWIPYVDSTVLLCVATAMLPVPLRGTWHAIREVLQLAPDDLNQEVTRVMDAVILKYGFLNYSSYVAKVGRVRFVEIHVLVPADYEFGSISTTDGIRREVSNSLQVDAAQCWLTVDFTGDPAWM